MESDFWWQRYEELKCLIEFGSKSIVSFLVVQSPFVLYSRLCAFKSRTLQLNTICPIPPFVIIKIAFASSTNILVFSFAFVKLFFTSPLLTRFPQTVVVFTLGC